MELVKASSVPGGDGESETKWSEIAKRLPGRLETQVKARWVNHLDPEIRKGMKWTKIEIDLLMEAQKELGNNWTEIAKRIPGRTPLSVRNRLYRDRVKKEAEAEEAETEKRKTLSTSSVVFINDNDKFTVVAPPGKLGIILTDRTDSRARGTYVYVSRVLTASVLATQVNPGDRIIAIDNEDVSQMNAKEVATIMARKSEFERVLTLLGTMYDEDDNEDDI